MGWHRYRVAGLAGRQPRHAARLCRRQHICCRRWSSCCSTSLVTALSFPAASLLTIFAGFLFGWLPGAGLAVIGATTGASLLFLAARTAFGGFLRDRAGGLAARFSKGFEEDAFAYLLVLRLAPFVPFFVVNIAPALCGVRPKVFRGGDGDRHLARRARLFMAGARAGQRAAWRPRRPAATRRSMTW